MKKALVLIFLAGNAWALDYAYVFGDILRDFGTRVRVDNGGNTFVACSLYMISPGYHAGAVGKIDPAGELEWLMLIGGPDSASALHRPQIAASPLGDGSLYVAGYYSEGSTQGSKVVKVDGNGNILWATWLYNDITSFYYARFPAIAVLPDGDCMVMWSTMRPPGSPSDYDLLFARLSGSDGQMLWYKAYHYSADDGYYDWREPMFFHALGLWDTTVMFNNLVSIGASVVSVSFRMDRDGNIIGYPVVPSGSNKWMMDMDTLPGGDIVSLWYTGRGADLGVPETLYIVRTNGGLTNTRWAQMRLGPDTVYGAFYTRPYMSITGAADTGCVVVGICSEIPYASSWLITRLSPLGEAEWHRTITESTNGQHFLASVDQAPNGDYVTAGTIVGLLNDDDVAVTRVTPDGSTCITRDTSMPLSSVSFDWSQLPSFTDVTSSYSGHIFAVQQPTTPTFVSYRDTVLCPAMHLNEDVSRGNDDLVKMWVGPDGNMYLSAAKATYISLSLYDISGRLSGKIYEGIVSSGRHAFATDIAASGVYIAVLRYQDKRKTLILAR